jgi:hypothetical protein
METANNKVTNVHQTAFVTLVSSVRIAPVSILPERFESTSSPVQASLVLPELGSVSGVAACCAKVNRIGVGGAAVE